MPVDQLTQAATKGITMHARHWSQIVVEFREWDTAEHVAVQHLRPTLATVGPWWFIRKRPCWRLRYLPAHGGAVDPLEQLLKRLAYEDVIRGWTSSIYEPETHALGGPQAVDVAHELFHVDSSCFLNHRHRQQTAAPEGLQLGRRELATLLISVLLRAAGLDWFEQGDVWAKVADLRPSQPATARPQHLPALMRRLMTVDAGPGSALVRNRLPDVGDWFGAFELAGQRLAELARRGALERGLRAVLAHHVIFAWNRLGLSYTDQHTLSTLAKEVTMGSTNNAPTTETDNAEALRNALVDQLRTQGMVRSTPVEAAFRTVPRHVFVPGVPAEEAYANTTVSTKASGGGVSISAASQPSIVAMMLEQLAVEPGQNILELGAGTGYNAALLAHVAGEHGHVTTIDVDDDIVEGARAGLAAAGVGNVRVILEDGAYGFPARAPYDRIIATVGAHGMPPAWLEQLAPDGRLVVPMRVRGSVSRSIVWERSDERWRSVDSQMCTFMPLRGVADDIRRIVALTPDDTVTLEAYDEQTVDATALSGVLDEPRSEAWTGVRFRGTETQEWMFLWLACALPGALSRMPIDNAAITRGLVKPQFPWGSMATVENASLAYLTTRQADHAADGGQLYEIGVIGHGRDGDDLVGRVAEEIRTWHRDHRGLRVDFEIRANGAEPLDPERPQFAVGTPFNRLVITWT